MKASNALRITLAITLLLFLSFSASHLSRDVELFAVPANRWDWLAYFDQYVAYIALACYCSAWILRIFPLSVTSAIVLIIWLARKAIVTHDNIQAEGPTNAMMVLFYPMIVFPSVVFCFVILIDCMFLSLPQKDKSQLRNDGSAENTTSQVS